MRSFTPRATEICVHHPVSGGFSGAPLFSVQVQSPVQAESAIKLLKLGPTASIKRQASNGAKFGRFIGSTNEIKYLGTYRKIGFAAIRNIEGSTLGDFVSSSSASSSARAATLRVTDALNLLAPLHISPRRNWLGFERQYVDLTNPRWGQHTRSMFFLSLERIERFNSMLHQWLHVSKKYPVKPVAHVASMLDSLRHAPSLDVQVGHGDFHCGNILVDRANSLWLIDFDRIGPAPYLWDYVVLEADLWFRILALSNPTVCDLEESLYINTSLLTTDVSRFFAPSPLHGLSIKNRMLFTLIKAIRHRAFSLILGSDSEQSTLQAMNEYKMMLLRRAFSYAERDEWQLDASARWAAATVVNQIEETIKTKQKNSYAQ